MINFDVFDLNVSIDEQFKLELLDVKPAMGFNFTNKLYSKTNFGLFQQLSTVLRKYTENQDEKLTFEDLVHIHTDFNCMSQFKI